MERSESRTNKIIGALEHRQLDFTVVLENVHDPHNVSAVLRTCDAVGIYEVFLVYYGGQKFPDLSKRSSASALKWVKLRFFDDLEKCFTALRKKNMKIFTTSISISSCSLYDVNFVQPIALVFGNEHSGVSKEAMNMADSNFVIPQVGMIESLNISVACAVSLYEGFRQRWLAGYYSKPQLLGARFEEVLQEWLLK